MLLKTGKPLLFVTSLLLSVMLTSCGDDAEPTPEAPDPTFTSIDPLSGPKGTIVTITGVGFSPTASENTVTFNGMEAEIVTASATELVVEVPARAGDGKVVVALADTTMTGPAFDYVEAYSVSTLAGSAEGFADGAGTEAQFKSPNSIAIDASGNLYIADFENHRIRKISPTGEVTTVAGSGVPGHLDGTGTDAQFNGPAGITLDASGNLFVTDFFSNLVRKITPAGEVTTFAGGLRSGYLDGTGTEARFSSPNSIVADANDNLYIVDSNNHRIRKITPEGEVTTFAGSGVEGYADGTGTMALFDWPSSIAIDGEGNLYVGENDNHRIRKITPAGVVTTLAGRGVAGSADGAGHSAEFNKPTGLAVDRSGYVYVADNKNNRIRKITPDGVVTTIAGSGAEGSADGIGTSAEFTEPSRVMIDADNNVYISDRGNHRIRKMVFE